MATTDGPGIQELLVNSDSPEHSLAARAYSSATPSDSIVPSDYEEEVVDELESYGIIMENGSGYELTPRAHSRFVSLEWIGPSPYKEMAVVYWNVLYHFEREDEPITSDELAAEVDRDSGKEMVQNYTPPLTRAGAIEHAAREDDGEKVRGFVPGDEFWREAFEELLEA